jgi:hypothetical protein
VICSRRLAPFMRQLSAPATDHKGTPPSSKPPIRLAGPRSMLPLRAVRPLSQTGRRCRERITIELRWIAVRPARRQSEIICAALRLEAGADAPISGGVGHQSTHGAAVGAGSGDRWTRSSSCAHVAWDGAD